MAETTDQNTNTVKEIEVDGYKFNVDTDLLDDVESLEFIERIENKGQVAAVLPLLKFIMGGKQYAELQAYFIKKDGEDHAAELKAAGKPADPDYRPRMRIEKLNDVYLQIIEKFDPKA